MTLEPPSGLKANVLQTYDALTPEEFGRLETHFATPQDAGLINYVAFCDELDYIFTDKTLEKNPTTMPASFNAPSILDPKDVLDAQEEEVLLACL